MGFQVSPGINVSEIDLTTIVPSVSTTDVGYAGVFEWGPLDEVKLISNEIELRDQFGIPKDDTAVSFFTCANVLSYGDKLRLVRVAADNEETFGPFTIENDGSSFIAPDNDGTHIAGTDFLQWLRRGSIVDDGAETRTVLEVVSDTEAIIDTAFTAQGPAVSVNFITYVGALNATAELFTGSAKPGQGVLIRNEDDYTQNFSNGLADVGPFAAKYAGELGNSLEVSRLFS